MLKAKASLARFLGWIAVVIFAVLVLTTVWQVTARQILHSPSTWSEEFAKICFVWLSFLGAAFVFGERGHIAVDFVARKFSEKVQRVIAVVVQVTILLFAIFGMIWGGLRAAYIAWDQNLTALPFTIGWVYLVIPISGVAIAIFSIIDGITIATGAAPTYVELEELEEPRDLDLLEAKVAEEIAPDEEGEDTVLASPDSSSKAEGDTKTPRSKQSKKQVK